MWLGAHNGIADGLGNAPRQGKAIGCESIQIFSKSPQMWAGPPVADEAASEFRAAAVEVGLKATAIHHGYLANLATPKKAMLTRSRKALVDELERAAKVGVDGLIMHPGAHMGEGVDVGIARIIESLDWALEKAPKSNVRILLENAAGQGTALCSNFRELRRVLDGVADKSRVAVALDTCHMFASGLDFRSPEAYGILVDQLESELGSSEVRAFHLNDSKGELGRHLDRHENIGKGFIGIEGFRQILNDPRWASTPGYLETPLTDDGYAAYAADLATLRSLVREGPVPAPPAAPKKRATAASTPK